MQDDDGDCSENISNDHRVSHLMHQDRKERGNNYRHESGHAKPGIVLTPKVAQNAGKQPKKRRDGNRNTKKNETNVKRSGLGCAKHELFSADCG
jgi:hypothetical protein